MGNECMSSSVCCQSNFCCSGPKDEGLMDTKDLESYQRQDINIIKLSKYDKFYRMAGLPFIWININDFMNDLEEM